MKALWLVLLAGCTSMTEAEREYAQGTAYAEYMDRKARCTGIWITEGFEHKDARRQSPVSLRMAGCMRKF